MAEKEKNEAVIKYATREAEIMRIRAEITKKDQVLTTFKGLFLFILGIKRGFVIEKRTGTVPSSGKCRPTGKEPELDEGRAGKAETREI